MLKLLITFCTLQFLVLSENIILLQEVFRHGARYALAPRFQPNLSSSIYGQLTSVGKRMHYLLGKHLYQQYWQQLGMPDYYNASLIRVNSTDFNRTIESCQSQLFGWFESLKKEQYQGKPIFDDINYQPVPINVYQKNIMYTDGQGEPMLYYDYPNNAQWKQNNYNSEFYKTKVEPILSKQLQYLKNTYNLDFNRTELISFIDGYHSNKSLVFDVHPVFKDPQHKGNLEFLYIISHYLDIFFSPEQISVSTTLFFSQLKQNLLVAIKGISPIKLRLYSAHDVTLMNFLVGFNLTNAQLAYQKHIVQNTTQKGPWSFPPYASNLLFQLFKSQQNILADHNDYNIEPNYVVRIRYNGMYLPLGFCKNKNKCSILDFLAFLDTLINPNYKQLAGFTQPIIIVNHSYITIILSVLLLVYITYKIFRFFTKKQQQMVMNTQSDDHPKSASASGEVPVQLKTF